MRGQSIFLSLELIELSEEPLSCDRVHNLFWLADIKEHDVLSILRSLATRNSVLY